ncbi:MAG: methionyl-tRNA formyltransferase [Nitrospirota bacterium]|nr:methionyl-tRNA formyltransferase [Nitrospirota bacterium]MDH5585958.1 methionyl-tRNA formyltransferase [Nitrospirota bacterium]MDH5776185.1 methionyl-tRNA formyltransferase [Nitrospirota bacterium]
MRVVFMGTPAFAVPTLQHLVDSTCTVVGVVCQPDRPSGRGKKIQFGPVKTLAVAQNLPVVQPEKMKDPTFLETLRTWDPDVIVVAAYGRILPQVILDLPPKGCLNVHGSLLPKYRGAAPIQWAVINGESETGVTIMVMDAGMDTGAILEQAVVPISPEDTAGEVASRMAELGGGLLVSTLQQWMAGTIDAHAQNESEATLAPILKKEDGLLDWHQSAICLANRIRGLSPWPGGYTFVNGERWGIWEVRVEETEETGFPDIQPGSPQKPGTIVDISKQMIRVQTGKGILHLLEIQPANKKRMSVGNYLAGHRLEVGTLLSPPQVSQDASSG